MRGEFEPWGYIVTATEGDPGHVTLAVYEKHKQDEPGQIIRIDLEVFDMLTLHEALTKALWHRLWEQEPGVIK